MSFDQLRYFVTVAEVGTTRAAAQALHISQPPLSRHIRALEDELGVALFDRSARGMALRPEGEELLGHARAILAAVDRAAVATQAVRGIRTEPRSDGPPRVEPPGEPAR